MESICTYLPASIIKSLQNLEQENLLPATLGELPTHSSYESVCLFADVSGFTKMCEVLAQSGANGNELLAKNLNSYFEMMVKIMSGQGGDVFKFAGDAIIVLWPPSPDDITSKVRRAAQCAVDIGEKLQEARLAEGVTLSVKVGIGVGKITILNVGGVINRLEYLAIGDPLAQAFHAEHHATKREIVVSPQAWDLVKEFFTADITDDGHAFLRNTITPIKKKNIHATTDIKNLSENVLKRAINYVSPAIVESCSRSEDRWISELRSITVLFVNLGVGESELVNLKSEKDYVYVHEIIKIVQTSVYKYEGSLNKFLMDDKGSTLIAVFGLPPCCHEDDAMRGCLAAVDICDSLAQFGLRASVGVTTGNAFCGVVGSRGRREYSVLGDIVNLSARLMQYATVHGTGVIVGPVARKQAERQVQQQAWFQLKLYSIANIQVKGKSEMIHISKPILKRKPRSFITSAEFGVNIPQHMLAAASKPGRYESKDEGKDLRDYLCSTVNLRMLQEPFEQMIKYFTNYDSDPEANKATVYLEADWGMGKSHLLYTALLQVEGEGMAANTAIITAKCNGFITRVKTMAFDVWRQVATQLLLNGRTEAQQSNNDIRFFIRQLAIEDELKSLLPCLNEAFDCSFEETQATLDMTLEERHAACARLFVAIVSHFVKKAPTALVLEDFQFADDNSWDVLMTLHEASLPLLLIVSSRPMNLSNMVAFSTTIPSRSLDFTRHGEVNKMTLPVWDTTSVLMLAARAIHPECRKRDIYPAPIGQLIVAKSNGNPRVVLELVEFAKTKLISVQENSSESGSRIRITPLVPLTLGHLTPDYIPPYVMSVMGSICDRLTRIELHIIKTAALLIGTISGKIVMASYPITKYKSENFDLAFANLVHMGILKYTKDDNPAETKDGMMSIAEEDDEEEGKEVVLSIHSEVKAADSFYLFRDGFMGDVIRSRMQNSTIETVQAMLVKNGGVVAVEDDDVEDESDNDGELAQGKVYSKSLLEGWLQKAGGRVQTWKTRYCILFSDKILYFETVDEARKMRAKGEIPLSSLSTVCWDPDKGQTENMFLISPSGGMSGERIYKFKADEKSIGERWIDKITKNIIEGVTIVGRERKQSASNSKRTSIMNMFTGVAGGRAATNSLTGRDSTVDVNSTGDNLAIVSEKVFDESVLEGWMLKTGGKIKTWNRRYFIMFHDKLLYFHSDTETTKALGEITLDPSTVCDPYDGLHKDGGGWFLRPTLGSRKYKFVSKDAATMNKWLEHVKAAVDSLAKRSKDDGADVKVATHSLMEGFLRKKGGTLGRWQTRYFIFFSNRLQWFHNRGDLNAAGEMTLYKDSMIQKGEKKTMIIKPMPMSKSYTISGKDEVEIDTWIKVLRTQAALQRTHDLQ